MSVNEVKQSDRIINRRKELEKMIKERTEDQHVQQRRDFDLSWYLQQLEKTIPNCERHWVQFEQIIKMTFMSFK